MAVVRFASDDVWRRCCDAARVRRTLGSVGARVVARRLQQLQAMRTLDDLAFMPFESRPLEDGMVEVTVNGDWVLLVEEAQVQHGKNHMSVFIINALCECSTPRPSP